MKNVALNDQELSAIEEKLYQGKIQDADIYRLLETIKASREVLTILFGFYRNEPLRLVSHADPVRNATLAGLRIRCGIVDKSA